MTKAIRYTEADLAEMKARSGVREAAQARVERPVVSAQQPDGVKRWQALGRMPKQKMNRTEEAYAALLDQKKLTGDVIDWKFHPFNVRLGDNTFYEVDFFVLGGDMRLSIHEVKGGYTSEKGGMKIKLCAEVLPYFRMVKASKQSKKDGGGWKIEEF